ncbi:MAG TPA: DEAD/DEAH box helicase [Phycisphaerales bacterium]|nr:DEAD/DEAH box helicase [Phycisphaerales bacterium]
MPQHDTRHDTATDRPGNVSAPLPPHAPGGSEEIFSKSDFASLGLRSSVLKGVQDAGFVSPTTIQAQLIPVILEGHDVLGQAKTGTGKTAAFGLPILHMADKGREFQALVLVPTRELAIQVAVEINELARHTPIRASAVIGGERVADQTKRLAKGPEILVATPGRIMDMHERRIVHYRHVRFVVLDEVDRMLDIGFRDDIRRILRDCPKERQTIFVSATISPEIEALARTHAREAKKLVASTGSLTVSLVEQHHLTVEPWDKRRLLVHLLTHEEPALTLIFCRMKRTVDELCKYLVEKGIDAHAMHGDMYQGKRNKIMQRLREGKLEVLIASDLASRGLDVDGITHVINYDLPEDPDIYVHRIGRTARAGRRGVAWSFVRPDEGKLLTQIEDLINAEIPKFDYRDFVPGPVPRGVLEERDRSSQSTKKAAAYNRFAASNAPPPPKPQVVDRSRFPGGIVPTKMPPKRLGGRVKTSRGVKEALAQQNTAKPKDEQGPPSAG